MLWYHSIWRLWKLAWGITGFSWLPTRLTGFGYKSLPVQEIFIFSSQWDCSIPNRTYPQFRGSPGVIAIVWKTDGSYGKEGLCPVSCCVSFVPFPGLWDPVHANSSFSLLSNGLLQCILHGTVLETTADIKCSSRSNFVHFLISVFYTSAPKLPECF